MTTPLFLLRAIQLGITISDLDLLSVGVVLDMMVEKQNDDLEWPELATQDDFNRF